jgi:hypothetical protein
MSSTIQLETAFALKLADRIGQLRATPMRVGGERLILAAHSADFDVDPYTEMFFFPQDTLHLSAFDVSGRVVWRRDLGRAVVPGMWFCPVLAMDLDEDGSDEVYFVNNTDPGHPLAHGSYVLEQLDAGTGLTRAQWPWPAETRHDTLSHAFRNFLIAGRSGSKPVLVCAQGTYHAMDLQGYGPGMSRRWRTWIAADAPGARGSHRCPVVDFDGSGRECLMWGERCIGLDDGAERFCCDLDVYQGHSDRIEPLLDEATGRWRIFTIREGHDLASPRVVMFDQTGKRLWGAVDRGHMDMGWVARVLDDHRHACMAIRIGAKTCGPDGRFHRRMDEYLFNAADGSPLTFPTSLYRTQPIDLNGDGYHELIRADPSGDGEVLDRHGASVGTVGGPCALLQKLTDHPGEQALSYHEDGVVRLWFDAHARDSEPALRRHAHPMYQRNARLMATGSNIGVLGGI